jgi:hypothetical protein
MHSDNTNLRDAHVLLRFCLLEKCAIVTEMYTSARRLALLVSALFLACACTVPPRMCVSERDCGSQASCVAGRCVAHGAIPAIDTARRLLFVPEDVVYLRGDADVRDAATATLGCSRERTAIVLLRFSARLAPEARVLEAYLVLERAVDVPADPEPISLHAARIAQAWDGRSVSWARQPRIEETGAPVTRVWPWAGRLVRLDVRALVQRWRRRGGEDFGVAVEADDATLTGITFALTPLVSKPSDAVLTPAIKTATQTPSPLEPHPVSLASIAEPREEMQGPFLEVYVK